MLKFSSPGAAAHIRVIHSWLSTKRLVERWVEERRICIERSVADHQKCGPRETVVDEDRDAAAVEPVKKLSTVAVDEMPPSG
jgi:hypothetical protein